LFERIINTIFYLWAYDTYYSILFTKSLSSVCEFSNDFPYISEIT
jgi:hypothetical protein